MSPIGIVSPVHANALSRVDAPLPKSPLTPSGPLPAAPHDGFGSMLDGLVGTVTAKQEVAQAMTRKVLLGESDQLHQSVLAMQEASVAFSLMVEVRNKVVESYQELMRMQV
ncbi:MAG TPA: flagellar hook-basal body complex protein FliE [Opitutus sp.]|nr:flagellar hook-basal body complex protein FliE [Opitutus sp.]